eukprot:CAMPEP_0119505754 /NCGR_PEP_ID=MMETSP1344-20130328/26219_1 /TAXON_ID=236787 /ORGANISM="Florenciella parvula, Strain CCMP2471" /LENGTH=64 /DNA_ID=CAMNT_0007542249 /DNA_START=295 /DNA_END=485 /DNA_ORIENTATION=-
MSSYIPSSFSFSKLYSTKASATKEAKGREPPREGPTIINQVVELTFDKGPLGLRLKHEDKARVV